MDGLFHTLETIGSGAFIDLPNLKEFLVKATTPPTWEYNDVFFSHEGGIGSTQAKYLGSIKLYVPDESIESYEASTFSNADLGWTTPDGWGSSVYYLTSGNQLIYTAKERTLKACRAYFIFTPNNGSSTNSFTFNINFGDGLNSIQNVKSNNQEEDTWFDLSGRRLNGKPTQKGIYVTKGHKAVIE